jgi:5-methylcytosine-specific restriction endonuclease McrA
VCTFCFRRYRYDWRKGHTRKICNSCRSNGKVSRAELKAELVAAKGGACQLCGYKKSLAALTFHHLDPETKRFTIAQGHLRSRTALYDEIARCVLLCENCHREVHGGAPIPEDVRAPIEAYIADLPRIPRRKPGRPAHD